MCPLRYWSYSHPSARSANTTWLTCGRLELALASQTAGARIRDQCAPPSAVTASCARSTWLALSEPPSTTPRVGDTKLAAAGWKLPGTLSEETGTACAGCNGEGDAEAALPAPIRHSRVSAPADPAAPSALMMCVFIAIYFLSRTAQPG